MSSAYAGNFPFTRVIVAHSCGSNWQLKLINFHKFYYCSPWDFNVGYHTSLDDQSTICKVSNRRDTHSGYYVMVCHRIHPRKLIVYPPSIVQTQFGDTLNRCSRRFQVVSLPNLTLSHTQTGYTLKPCTRRFQVVS